MGTVEFIVLYTSQEKELLVEAEAISFVSYANQFLN